MFEDIDPGWVPFFPDERRFSFLRSDSDSNTYQRLFNTYPHPVRNPNEGMKTKGKI
jgi:hypothetical protein